MGVTTQADKNFQKNAYKRPSLGSHLSVFTPSRTHQKLRGNALKGDRCIKKMSKKFFHNILTCFQNRYDFFMSSECQNIMKKLFRHFLRPKVAFPGRSFRLVNTAGSRRRRRLSSIFPPGSCGKTRGKGRKITGRWKQYSGSENHRKGYGKIPPLPENGKPSKLSEK
jgi:hypothetical protein